MKKRVVSLVFACILVSLIMSGCTGNGTSTPSTSSSTDPSSNSSITSSGGGESSYNSYTSFTNDYGTPTTVCAHSGCTNYIASSGDTNCCATHSRKCLECNCYIDEDAMYCMDCLTKAANSGNSSSDSSHTYDDDYDYDKGCGYTAPIEGESFSDYVKRQDPDLYEDMQDIWDSLG